MENSPKLTGYNIPGTNKKTIVNLYADDTTIFLWKSDRYTDLEQILSKWCLTSGAKFNLEKTEILLIGSKEHRERMRTSRRLHEQDQCWDENIRIAQDGCPIRTLGAWIGNETDNATPWEPIPDKIEKNLEKWNISHPTLYGKRLIIQMIAGGMTQFLMKAQDMPASIENALIKKIRNFFWNNAKTPPMSLERLT
ncbi:hypothetical protein BDR05DRAFT_981467 [Suillus weaverae]|nr:hypothetical protein BDR05DRAFT_981467 [Suillus weaverae]